MYHTLVALVEDKPGVLNRVASLFRRRAFNIESLTVGRTAEQGVSRMTIVLDSDQTSAERVTASDSDLTAHLVKQGTEAERTVLRLEPSPDDVAESLAVRIHDHAVRGLVRKAVRGSLAGAVGRSSEHQFLWAAMAAEEINARARDLRQPRSSRPRTGPRPG